MTDIAQLAALMYRPRWSVISVSGSVRSFRPGREREGPSGRSGMLWLAPGGRYRADLVDADGDRSLDVSDGRSVWIVEDGVATNCGAAAAAVVPFPDLLNPAWMLAGYRLEVSGRCEHAGRAGVAVTGYERESGRTRGRPGKPAGRIDAVIDADLGIVLRFETAGSGSRDESAEFTELLVRDGESADPALFRVPEGVRLTGEDPPPSASAASGTWQGGGSADQISDELVGALYEAGLRPQRFSAVLHEQADAEAIAATFRAESAGRGSMAAKLTDFAADHVEPVNLTARLQLALPRQYRIELLTGTAPGPTVIVCDGELLWQVYPDRVFRWPAAPPPASFAPLLDPAWLLAGYRLTDAGPATVAGRLGNRIVAEPDEGSTRGRGVVSRVFYAADKIDVVLDVQLRIALRTAWSWQENTLFTTELRDLSTETESTAFTYEPPPGTRIVTSASPLAGITAKDAARSAIKAANLFADIAKRASKRRPGT